MYCCKLKFRKYAPGFKGTLETPLCTLFDDHDPYGKNFATLKHWPVTTAEDRPFTVEEVKIRSLAVAGHNGQILHILVIPL